MPYESDNKAIHQHGQLKHKFTPIDSNDYVSDVVCV